MQRASTTAPSLHGTTKSGPPGAGGSPNWYSGRCSPFFFPELTQIIQPLSGEYAGYRTIFDKIPFPIGYGIETSMILDIYHEWGLEVIAQVDLERRVHRNQSTKALGKMAFTILKTFIKRKVDLGLIELKESLHDQMIQYAISGNDITPEILSIPDAERPPMIDIPEYRKKFGIVLDPDPCGIPLKSVSKQ
jgi:glucosyl-3-phosphoglycerate synthase